MNDYHWADIAEAPRDGTWIHACQFLHDGHPYCVEVAFVDGGFEDSSGCLWEPQYFVKEGPKP